MKSRYSVLLGIITLGILGFYSFNQFDYINSELNKPELINDLIQDEENREGPVKKQTSYDSRVKGKHTRT